MKVKICGMKLPDNIRDIAELSPDYFGFIFYNKSPRYMAGDLPALPKTIKKVGVFVDASANEILRRVQQYELDAIQLHGTEQPDLCEKLRGQGLEVLKVFSVGSSFNFKDLEPYEKVVDYFLFDTKGKAPGGNGLTFNWDVLKSYPSKIPFFLSGGIGITQAEAIKELHKVFLEAGKNLLFAGIDLNSRFESAPGIKQRQELEDFLDVMGISKEYPNNTKQ